MICAKGFSHALAVHLAHEIAQHFTANMAKQRRKGKIFIDYLRNGRGNTAVRRLLDTHATGLLRVSAPLLPCTDLPDSEKPS